MQLAGGAGNGGTLVRRRPPPLLRARPPHPLSTPMYPPLFFSFFLPFFLLLSANHDSYLQLDFIVLGRSCSCSCCRFRWNGGMRSWSCPSSKPPAEGAKMMTGVYSPLLHVFVGYGFVGKINKIDHFLYCRWYIVAGRGDTSRPEEAWGAMALGQCFHLSSFYDPRLWCR